MSQPFIDYVAFTNALNPIRENNRIAREMLEDSAEGDGLLLDYISDENLVHIVVSGRGIEVLEFADGLYAAFNNEMQTVVHYVSVNVHMALTQFTELKNLTIRRALSGRLTD